VQAFAERYAHYEALQKNKHATQESSCQRLVAQNAFDVV
jgi:hypothetical protein